MRRGVVCLHGVTSHVRRPASWDGHSFGGGPAFELAAPRPEPVDRLVLLDPAVDRRDETSRPSTAPRGLLERELAAEETIFAVERVLTA
jgi:pimeloyl-ACP methyl ester carboxylesterase